MKFIKFVLIFVFILIFPLCINAKTQEIRPEYKEVKILHIYEDQINQHGIEQIEQELEFEILKGDEKGKKIKTTNFVPKTVNYVKYKQGDKVIISIYQDPNSNNVQIYIIDYVRRKELILLLIIFLALVFLVSKGQGILSFLSMIITFGIINFFIVPQIIKGASPITISLISAAIISPITYYMSHGINKKTTRALIGTLFALALITILAHFFINATKLSGFANEQAIYLQSMKNGVINIKNLLLAGIIIGSLGVLDDITVAQAAIVEKLHKAKPSYSLKELYKHSMHIGNDHIASMVNTLILVYAGASLPLFILFQNSQMSYGMAINQEIVGTERIRTLIASIGLVSAVPITTFLSCYLEKKESKLKKI